MNSAPEPGIVRDAPMAILSIDDAIAKVNSLRMVIEHMYPADKLEVISEMAAGKVQLTPTQGSMVPIPIRMASAGLSALNALYVSINGPQQGKRYPMLEPKQEVDNCVATRVAHPKIKDRVAYNLTWLEENSCLLMDSGLVLFRTVQPVLCGKHPKVVALVAHIEDFTKVLTSEKQHPGVFGAMGGGVVLSNLLVQPINAGHIKQLVAKHTMAVPDTSVITLFQIIGTGSKAVRWNQL